ncbi:MAG TPA: gamma-glutamyltransferase [Gemmatimonadales bacterium]|nr:gamma-glutamyltransferase [Gemmatimonadales bacterium]
MLRPHLIAALVLSAAACAGRGGPEPGIPATWRYSPPAPPVVGQRAMVVSEHPLASDIGAQVLREGGNAIDAAVAVGFAQQVVNPRAGNIGGGGFLVYRQADGQVFALDYREMAPARAHRNMFLDSAGNVTEASTIGALANGVPGSVAGLYEMHRRFGRLPWRRLVEPAIRLAREGHVVDSIRAAVIESNRRRLARFPSTAAIFLPDGAPLAAGTLWIQPELAETLDRIAEHGADGFYRGRTADLIVAQMQRSGGLITHEDLQNYRAVWREPIRITYRGWTIYSMPPSSSGGVTLAMMLNILEGFPRLPRHGSAELAHLQVEVMRRAFTDRNRYLGDPDFVAMPLERLLSKEYAAQWRRSIDFTRATPSSEMPPIVESEETTHYSIVDPDGNAASVTTTLNDNFGNALVVAGAGFLLNNEMDDFSSRPGTPNDYGLVQGEANAIAPRKRMLSAMTPTIALNRQGRLELVLGAPGGPRIITGVFQVLSNVIDHRMSLAEAVYAPRIHHQSLPDSIRWEDGGVRPEVRARLEAMGHRFFTRPASNAVVEAIRITRRGIEGVFDPRTPGGAAGF